MIELLPFQLEAASIIQQRFRRYFDDRPFSGTVKKPIFLPFYQALKAVTGAGKTAILAECVERIRQCLPAPPIVLWLSKGRVVVDQTYSNIAPGGKYNHLINAFNVRFLSEFRTAQLDDGIPQLYFATVGTFNQKDKELGERLIFKSELDTTELSTWQGLKRRIYRGFRLPLVVVYDESHNLTDQQFALLSELEPDAFLAASATMRPPLLLSKMLQQLKERGWSDDDLIFTVKSDVVADSGLIKQDVFLNGFEAGMYSIIDEVVKDWRVLCRKTAALKKRTSPKIAYVCRTNIVDGDSLRKDDPARPFLARRAAPILIWRHLTEKHNLDPNTIAVYCNLQTDKRFPLPDEFHLFSGGDKDYEKFRDGGFRHVIFNLGLQEGWDDPELFFLYVDKSMGSPIQVEQLIGRALRQPHAEISPVSEANAAYAYVRVDNKAIFQEIIDKVRGAINLDAPSVTLRIKEGREQNYTVYAPKVDVNVPKVWRDPSRALPVIEQIISETNDYRAAGSAANVHGSGSRTLVKQRVGSRERPEIETYTLEHNNLVSARWVFQRYILERMPGALEVAGSDNPIFDAQIEIGSRAYAHIRDQAQKVIDCYLAEVELRQRVHNPFIIADALEDADSLEPFKNAVHDGYSGLNPLELKCARLLDRAKVLWCRNPSRRGFGIPLLTVGRTNVFYPDFIVWRRRTIIAVDTTGEHLLRDKTARKLLAIRAAAPRNIPALSVRLLSAGSYDENVRLTDKNGYSRWRLRPDGRILASRFNTLEEAVASVLEEE